MDRLTQNKIVLVVRETRLEELKARFNTVEQARFYVEHQGGDFNDYEQEDRIYRDAVAKAQQCLGPLGRIQVVHRSFLPNFIFGPEDTAVAIGQDGLVANTLKYLQGQPLVGVNPDPERFDGQLLPFLVSDLCKVMPEVFRRTRGTKSITMAKASLNDGRVLYAVNDLFIGPKSHVSARYTIRHEGVSERQSSSGVIVSTGLGSTGWFSSLVEGAYGLSSAFSLDSTQTQRSRKDCKSGSSQSKFDWNAKHLVFTVREPFRSKTTAAALVFGTITETSPLEMVSQMPERGVIFSDGVEADFLEFNSGSQATITLADREGQLVV